MNPKKTIVLGVMNITPDSFYDGGKLNAPKIALTHAKQLIADGADWLDIGGESSRPGAEPVGVEEELRRILPIVEAVHSLNIPLSIDTYRAETARQTLALGARMVNDISALRMDPEMADVIAEADCDCILMHMRGNPKTMQQAPEYDNVIDTICAFFEERLNFAARQGIKEDKIWLDPGFGFGKTVAHNCEILRRLAEFKRFGRPILIGTSNKSTIGTVLDLPVTERTEGTAATVALGIANGADAIRVHDVKTMARVAKMSDAIIRNESSGLM